MPIRNNAARYGSVAMFFHWLIAVLVIANLALGLYFSDLPRSDANLFVLAQTHKSIGLTVLVLSVLRVVWRLINPVPPLPADLNPALKVAARVSHVLLYVLIVAIPLTGWVMVSTSRLGIATPYFGLFDWPNLPFFGGYDAQAKHEAHEFWENSHALLAWSAIVLIPIHIAAALYHQYIRRDEVMNQMMPGKA